VTARDTVAGSPTMTTRYDYSGGAAWHYQNDVDANLPDPPDQTWNDFRGYASVKVTQGGTTGAQTITDYRYFRGMHGDRNTSGVDEVATVSTSAAGEDFPARSFTDYERLAGRLLEVQREAAGGWRHERTVHEYWSRLSAAGPAGRSQPHDAYLVREEMTATDTRLSGSTEDWRRRQSSSTFNDFGYPTEVREHGQTGVFTDDSCVLISYTDNAMVWLRGLAYQQETTDCYGGRLALTQTYYDGNIDDTAPGDPPTDGYVTKTELRLEPGSGTAEAVTRIRYDAYGREYVRNQPNGGADRLTSTDYSPTTGFPYSGVTIRNNRDHRTLTVPSPSHGGPSRTEDPNGTATVFDYDALGRLLTARHSGVPVDTPNYKFTYTLTAGQPARIRSSQLQDSAGEVYLRSYTYLDGLGRTREVQTVSPAGGRIVSATRYDDRGLLARQAQPLHDPGAGAGSNLLNPWGSSLVETRTTYDFLARPTKVELVERDTPRWATTTSYTNWSHTVSAPVRTPVTYHSDVFGRTSSVVETLPSGSATTSYGYSRLGQLTAITDAAGSLTSYGYDLAGRRTSSTDPDMGTWTYFYDSAGNQTTMVGGKQNTTTNPVPDTLHYSYDDLNRRTGVFQDSVSEANKLSEWTYDTPGVAGSIGRPVASSRIIGGQRYTTAVSGYDTLGRPTGSSWSIPSGGGFPDTGSERFTVAVAGNSYDHAGHLTASTLPTVGGVAGETLSFGFTDLGLPSTVTSGTTYVAATSFDAVGRLTGRDLGAGSALTQRRYSYDTLSRLASIKTTVPTATTPTVQDDTYSYDNAGNITGIARTAPGVEQRECFQYGDGLNRLTRAFTRAVKDATGNPTLCAATPNPDSTSPAPYDKTYVYDQTGNLTTVTNHKLPTGSQLSTYDYKSPATAPHAVKTISGVNPGSYGYDANGAMTSRSTGGVSATLAWDRLHQLEKITTGSAVTSFVYGADGQRLLRKDPGGKTTLYAAGMEIVASGGAVTATRFYPGGAMRRGTDPVQWIVTDHQNSTLAVVTANGTATTTVARPQEPYGARRTTTAMPTERGFLGKPEDPTGLVATDNRYYDPAIGRFISPDPVLVPADPQTLNGYAYSHNNPVTYMDPSGLEDNYRSKSRCGCVPPPPATPAPPSQPSQPDHTPVGTPVGPPGTVGENYVWGPNGTIVPVGVPDAWLLTAQRSSPDAACRFSSSGAITCAVGLIGRLPTDGSFPFEPKKGQRLSQPRSIQRESGDPVDKHGDKWEWDPIKEEWDVQHQDGSHTNVGPDGEITHGENNTGREPKSRSGDDSGKAEALATAGAAGGILVVLWWIGKLAAPVCGPAAPACVVVF
jgi:RHS repeat-associated protein